MKSKVVFLLLLAAIYFNGGQKYTLAAPKNETIAQKCDEYCDELLKSTDPHFKNRQDCMKYCERAMSELLKEVKEKGLRHVNFGGTLIKYPIAPVCEDAEHNLVSCFEPFNFVKEDCKLCSIDQMEHEKNEISYKDDLFGNSGAEITCSYISSQEGHNGRIQISTFVSSEKASEVFKDVREDLKKVDKKEIVSLRDEHEVSKCAVMCRVTTHGKKMYDPYLSIYGVSIHKEKYVIRSWYNYQKPKEREYNAENEIDRAKAWSGFDKLEKCAVKVIEKEPFVIVDDVTKRSTTIYSIPKNLSQYRFRAVLPSEFIANGGDSFSYVKWYDEQIRKIIDGKKLGEMEIVFSWEDRNGGLHKRSFRKPFHDLYMVTDQQQKKNALSGEMILEEADGPKSPPALIIGYKILDELENVVRDPKNGQQECKKGEQIFRGSELSFQWQVLIYDGTSLVAKSPGNTELKFILRYPVIFLPGTAGSRLSVKGYTDSTGSSEIWPAIIWSGIYHGPFIGKKNLEDWSLLKLDKEGKSTRPVTATDIFRLHELAYFYDTVYIYKAFLEHMTENGYREDETLFTFPYDWRLGIDKHVTALMAMVARVLYQTYDRKTSSFISSKAVAGALDPNYESKKTDKVILIGHSQGGLIARNFVRDSKYAKKVEDLIMVGTPNLGSLKVFKALGGTGYSFESPWLHPEIGKIIGGTWFSPYHMLPVKENGELEYFLFDEKKREITNISYVLKNRIETHALCYTGHQKDAAPDCTLCKLDTQRLENADKVLRSLHSTNPVQNGVNVFIVAGYGINTIVSFRKAWKPIIVSHFLVAKEANHVSHAALRNAGYLPPSTLFQDVYYTIGNIDVNHYIVALPYYKEVFSPCGDGTVPLHSAIDVNGLRGAYVSIVQGINHGVLMEKEAVQKIIDLILRGVRPDGMSDNPEPPCNSMPTPYSKGVQVSVSKSPANLNVYDIEGRHTGLSREGELEIQIPGSQFEESGNTQNVWLPYSDTKIKVVLEGLIKTEFNMEVTAGDGQSESGVDYIGVKETSNMQGILEFVPSELGSTATLEIDLDGNHKIDKVYKPIFTSSITATGGRPVNSTDDAQYDKDYEKTEVKPSIENQPKSEESSKSSEDEWEAIGSSKILPPERIHKPKTSNDRWRAITPQDDRPKRKDKGYGF